jgi:hypothetical protein
MLYSLVSVGFGQWSNQEQYIILDGKYYFYELSPVMVVKPE